MAAHCGQLWLLLCLVGQHTRKAGSTVNLGVMKTVLLARLPEDFFLLFYRPR